jgi:predicted DNA-binding transcriptional regulator YafY
MSQIERITYLDRMLREKRPVRAADVARRFEVSGRQVLRDIEYLRDRFDAPLEWEASTRSYRYRQPFDVLRFADEKLLIFHALARSMAKNDHYIPVVSEEILAELESHIARDYRSVSDRIRWELPVSERTSMEDFTTVCQAMLLGQRLELAYVDAVGTRSERRIEPERLVNYSGRWYLVAWDLERSALRTFHLSRVESLILGREKASSPRPAGATQEEIERFVNSGFGIFMGSKTIEAKIRVRGKAAPLVARQEWHANQRVEQGVEADGSPWTDLSFPVADVTELLGRVLSFGSSAEPLAPPELCERWQKEIAAMTALAKGTTTQATATSGVEHG